MHLQLLLVGGAKSLSRGNIERKINTRIRSAINAVALLRRVLGACAVVFQCPCLEHGGKDTGSNHRDALPNQRSVGSGGGTMGSTSSGRGILDVLAGRRGLGGLVLAGAARALAGGAAVASIGLGGVKGAAVRLDVGLALVLATRAASVGLDAVGEGLLADEL